MDYHFTNAQVMVFVLLAAWELVWKGFAMWRAARRREPWWFVAMLVINTVGILPIAYLLMTNQEEEV